MSSAAYTKLYNNVWAISSECQLHQTTFLANAIYGYLHDTFGRDASRVGQSECIESIQECMERTIARHPTILPSTFIRALYLFLRYTGARGLRAKSTEEALVLYLASFFTIASALDERFTSKQFKMLHAVRTRTVMKYRAGLVDALEEEKGTILKDSRRVNTFLHRCLCGLVPECELRSHHPDEMHLPSPHRDPVEHRLMSDSDSDKFRRSYKSRPVKGASTQTSAPLSTSSDSLKSASSDGSSRSRHYIGKWSEKLKAGARYTGLRLRPVPRSQF
ncbi:hypothetical protein CC2G_004293 [Coprinopsis cinerea AmutBmut pab1-1]|nr:hypothetical protein CC2G_004293 [Coprinopsis cinerea AmutBmut pab1-1]